MSRIWIDGFECGSLISNTYTPYNNYPSIVSTSGLYMSGSYCASFGSWGGCCYPFPAQQTEVYLHLRFRITGYCGLAHFYDSGGTRLLTIYCPGVGGKLSIFDSFSLTGTTILEGSRTYLLDIYYKPHDTLGSFILKIDGTVDCSYSGDTTRGLANISQICFGYNNSISQTTHYMDDLVIDNANWIGNTRIKAIVPTGAGNSTSWTPSTGSNYACLDEIAPSDTDYVSTNITDNVDTYAFGDLSGASSIKSVSVTTRCGYDGTPTPKNVQLVARIGSTNYVSTSKAVPLSFANVHQIWENSPATSEAWTVSELNAAEFGIKAVA